MTAWAETLVEMAQSQLTERERDALMCRGATDSQIELYRIGHLTKELPPDAPEEFSMWADEGRKLDDVFVFPLTTAMGKVNGFQFRHVDRSRSGYMDFFFDHREACLFGLHQAIEDIWKRKEVFLVEGTFDLFPIQRAVGPVVATLTSYANRNMVRLMRRLVDKVWLGYDMDEPGEKGVEKFRKYNGHMFEVYRVEYPHVSGKFVKDPGELWELWGDDQFIPYLKSAMTQNDLFAL